MTRLRRRRSAVGGSRPAARRIALALPAAGAAAVLAVPAFAASTWVITPTVNPVGSTLNAVGARTGTDAWAVGSFRGPNEDDGAFMLAEHWNGSAWSQVPTPASPLRVDEKLDAVSAAAANDVWAVGSTNPTGFKHTDPIAAHWDGTSWTVVPTPATTGGSKSILFGVANLGGGDAWAVGRSEGNRALAEHWNGSAWSIVPTPDPTAPAGMTFAGSTLSAVSARAANDIWAVGYFQAAQGTKANSFTLTMHWNGSAWSIVRSPNPATVSQINGVRQSLNGVVEISANDAWAVGNTVDTASGSFQPNKPIAMHWNGTAWSVSTMPSAVSGSTNLLASVTASSSTSVWADGGSAVLHWNGTSWTQESLPTGSDSPLLKGIGAVPGTASEVWADGDIVPSGDTSSHPFVVHHP